MVAPVRIVHRSAYQDAQGRGLGVTEYEPEGKAAEEVIALWKWVTRKLEKLNHEGKANGTGSSAVVDESVPGSRVG
jgi:hypothetical protein